MQPLTFDFGTSGNGDQKDIQTEALIKMLGGGMQQQNPRAGAMGGINSAVQAMLPMLLMQQQKPPMLSTPVPQPNPALTGAGDLPMVG